MQDVSPARARGESPIGRRLLRIVRERGWSLNKLSAMSGVSVSQISLLTRGLIVNPRADTLQAICAALEVPESALLGVTSERIRRRADLRGTDGVTTVSVVEVKTSGDLVETGETYPIAVAQLDGRRRLFATVVDGGGMAPHVLSGDRVLFDPDDSGDTEEQLVLMVYAAITMVAWRLRRDGQPRYWISDNVWLDERRVRTVVGTVVYIMRPPPAFRGP